MADKSFEAAPATRNQQRFAAELIRELKISLGPDDPRSAVQYLQDRGLMPEVEVVVVTETPKMTCSDIPATPDDPNKPWSTC